MLVNIQIEKNILTGNMKGKGINLKKKMVQRSSLGFLPKGVIWMDSQTS